MKGGEFIDQTSRTVNISPNIKCRQNRQVVLEAKYLNRSTDHLTLGQNLSVSQRWL
jgi:hypothetical protein